MKEADDEMEDQEEDDGIAFQRTDIRNTDEVLAYLHLSFLSLVLFPREMKGKRMSVLTSCGLADRCEGANAEQGHLLPRCTHGERNRKYAARYAGRRYFASLPDAGSAVVGVALQQQAVRSACR
jgi:hypothetical protein